MASQSIKETVYLIIGVAIVISVLFIMSGIIGALIGKNRSANTRDSTRSLVEIINTMNNNEERSEVLTINKGNVIAGFNSGESIKFKRASGWFHMGHINGITRHPETGTCTNSDTCICACTTDNYCKENKGQCYALNETIKEIYVKGDGLGLNIGQEIYPKKDTYYLVLATTNIFSYHILANITKNGDTVFVELSAVK